MLWGAKGSQRDNSSYQTNKVICRGSLLAQKLQTDRQTTTWSKDYSFASQSNSTTHYLQQIWRYSILRDCPLKGERGSVDFRFVGLFSSISKGHLKPLCYYQQLFPSLKHENLKHLQKEATFWKLWLKV